MNTRWFGAASRCRCRRRGYFPAHNRSTCAKPFEEGGLHVRLLAFEAWAETAADQARSHPSTRRPRPLEEVRIDLRPEELPGAGLKASLEGVGLANQSLMFSLRFNR